MPIINGVYRPDFQADNQLPRWIPMDDENNQTGQNVTAIGGAFKDRFSRPPTSTDMPHGASQDHPMIPPMGGGGMHPELPVDTGAHTDPMKQADGFKSLG